MGLERKLFQVMGYLENTQNHPMCPQGTVPGMCPSLTVTPSVSGLSVQGAAPRPWPASLDLTSSSLAAGDIYVRAEATKALSDALFP